MKDDSLANKHIFLLRNIQIQEYRNSLNAGRPKDALERVTKVSEIIENEQKILLNEDEDPLNSYYAELMINMDLVVGPNDLTLKDENGTLHIDSCIVTKAGSRKCGKKLTKMPLFDNFFPSVVKLSSSDQSITPSTLAQDMILVKRKIVLLDKYSLIQLHTKTYEVITTGDECKVSKFTGTLENINKYAKCSFSGDNNQELAFVLVYSAFVMSLHNKVTSTSKKTKKR